MLVPSLVFSAIQILTSVVDQSGLKKKINHHSTKYFSSPFRLIWFDDANVYSFRIRLNLHIVCLLYTYYKFWRHVKIVNRRGMYVY